MKQSSLLPFLSSSKHPLISLDHSDDTKKKRRSNALSAASVHQQPPAGYRKAINEYFNKKQAPNPGDNGENNRDSRSTSPPLVADSNPSNNSSNNTTVTSFHHPPPSYQQQDYAAPQPAGSWTVTNEYCDESADDDDIAEWCSDDDDGECNGRDSNNGSSSSGDLILDNPPILFSNSDCGSSDSDSGSSDSYSSASEVEQRLGSVQKELEPPITEWDEEFEFEYEYGDDDDGDEYGDDDDDNAEWCSDDDDGEWCLHHGALDLNVIEIIKNYCKSAVQELVKTNGYNLSSSQVIEKSKLTAMGCHRHAGIYALLNDSDSTILKIGSTKNFENRIKFYKKEEKDHLYILVDFDKLKDRRSLESIYEDMMQDLSTNPTVNISQRLLFKALLHGKGDALGPRKTIMLQMIEFGLQMHHEVEEKVEFAMFDLSLMDRYYDLAKQNAIAIVDSLLKMSKFQAGNLYMEVMSSWKTGMEEWKHSSQIMCIEAFCKIWFDALPFPAVPNAKTVEEKYSTNYTKEQAETGLENIKSAIKRVFEHEEGGVLFLDHNESVLFKLMNTTVHKFLAKDYNGVLERQHDLHPENDEIIVYHNIATKKHAVIVYKPLCLASDSHHPISMADRIQRSITAAVLCNVERHLNGKPFLSQEVEYGNAILAIFFYQVWMKGFHGGRIQAAACYRHGMRLNEHQTPLITHAILSHKEWIDWFNLLIHFKNENNHCNVPARYKEKDGNALGWWCIRQRIKHSKGELDKELEQKLNDIGFCFSLGKQRIEWIDWCNLLIEFKNEHHHCNVPARYKDRDGKALGAWCSRQRIKHSKGELDKELEQKLNDIGFCFSLGKQRIEWIDWCNLLIEFKNEHHHCNVPAKYKDKDGNALGDWCSRQRIKRRKGELDKELEQKLNDIGFCFSLGKQQIDWCNLLIEFTNEHHHCNVPHRYVKDGNALGEWCSRQRIKRRKGKLDKELEQKLNDIGFSWGKQRSKQRIEWIDYYNGLIEFTNENHHCNVPRNYKDEDGNALGEWCNRQRSKRRKGELDKELEQKLNDIGFCFSLGKQRIEWIDWCNLLIEFKNEHHHCNVPAKYKDKDGKALGDWCSRQRIKRRKGELDKELEQKLNDIGFSWGKTS